MNTPHKHRDLIIAWANGETIEVCCNNNQWKVETRPDWWTDVKYRVKPDIRTKLKQVVNRYVIPNVNDLLVDDLIEVFDISMKE